MCIVSVQQGMKLDFFLENRKHFIKQAIYVFAQALGRPMHRSCFLYGEVD